MVEPPKRPSAGAMGRASSEVLRKKHLFPERGYSTKKINVMTLVFTSVSFKLTVAVTEMANNLNILNQLTVTVTEIMLVTEM